MSTTKRPKKNRENFSRVKKVKDRTGESHCFNHCCVLRCVLFYLSQNIYAIKIKGANLIFNSIGKDDVKIETCDENEETDITTSGNNFGGVCKLILREKS